MEVVHLMETKLGDKVALFNSQANKHLQNQAINPFSNGKQVTNLDRPKFSKEEYGRPPPGSLSEKRSQKANVHIFKEMLELCEIVNEYGAPYNADGHKGILFGELFNIYTAISDKLVGMLLRARKHKLLDFEGECLFQRRDDYVPVFLVHTIQEIRTTLKEKIDTAMKLSADC